jgi:hypothetical protein
MNCLGVVLKRYVVIPGGAAFPEPMVIVFSLKLINGCSLHHHGRNWMSMLSRVTIILSLHQGSHHPSVQVVEEFRKIDGSPTQ